VTIPFEGLVIDFDTTIDSYLYMPIGLVDIHRENIDVGENTFLVKNEC
jgi:hypothetical protein